MATNETLIAGYYILSSRARRPNQGRAVTSS
jgi:hypothetical protein